MAEVKSPSTKDLLLLIFGLQVPKAPPAAADSGDVYWLNEVTTEEERTLRDSQLNSLWLSSPEKAWKGVRFRDWLIQTLIRSIADNKQEFVAVSEPLLASIDVLSKEFARNVAGVTDAIKEALKAKEGERSLFNTLSIGLSRHVHDGKEVFLLGAGMRRRASYWRTGTDREAWQADVEFLVPFFILPSEEAKDSSFPNFSICAGVALSRKDGSPIGKDADKNELIAARFNLRVPFGTKWVPRVKSDEHELQTVFGTPEIKIQKRIRETNNTVSDWKEFKGWKEFITPFVADPLSGKELLNVPIGPLLLEKVSDPAGIKDIILKQKKRDKIKEELIESKEEFKEQIKFLENIQNWTPPDPKPISPTSGNRKLGNMLESLGFLSAKGSATEAEYTFKVTDGLTVWDVVNRIFKELDGYPLWVKGVSPKSDKEMRAALTLASQASEVDANKQSDNKQYFGLAGLFYNIALKTVSEDDAKKEKDSETPTIVISKENFTKDESIFIEEDEEEEDEGFEPKPEPEEKKEEAKDKPKSTVEVFLHLGKWLSGETLDDNWFQRLLPPGDSPLKKRVPIPGIRLLPIKRVQNAPATGNKDALFSWTFRADLLSLGVDIKGATKDGLTFLQGLAGHFGLGAIEVRLALKFSAEDVSVSKEWFDRFSVGVGVKLKDLRLSFGPKEEEKKKEKSGHEIIDGLGDVLGDDWVSLPAPKKPEETKVRTRLTGKKKDKFSISFGYLTPLTKDSHGTLDVQLYDEKGVRGKMVLIPIDRQASVLYVRQIGILLKGVENIELSKGLPDSAQLTVAITGGLRLPVFELGLIGAKLTFPLNQPSAFKFSLDGLDVSIKIGDIVISGAFFKSGIEYAGMLTVDHPKVSFAAMGFYGSLRVLNIAREDSLFQELNRGQVPKKLKDKLLDNKITPAVIKKSNVPDEWELKDTDGKRYTITDDDDKLNVLRPDKTFFVYAMLTAGSGGGPTFGPIQFNGIALGYGYNRKLIVPRIEKVAEFPLVQMVMGEGGYQKDDTSLDVRTQLGKPLEDPVSMLEKFKDHVVAEAGQQFACGGARFTIGGLVDCFALIVVQWNEKTFEIALLGLARFRHTRDLTAKAICYVEMQLLLTLKPSEGTFQLQAQLTSNSWILTPECKLTGGFALFIWFGGEHKGDWVFTLGGYHPRFKRPEHYPVVPRLGLNWPVTDKLTIKGGLYFAVTPACLMLGARLEATFHSGRISAWFTAYLDVVVNWDPVYFEAELGISLRVEASFFLTSIKVTIAASIQMWGPPVGGIAHVDLTLISFDINFGEKRPQQVELIKTWQKFCHKFLNMTGADDQALSNPIKAFPIVQPNLAGGRNNPSSLPNSKPENNVWIVRADELELAATAAVPVTTMNLGQVKPDSIQKRSYSGQPVMIANPVVLESDGLSTKKSTNKYGAHPMGKTVDSVLNVTVVKDEFSGTHAEKMSGWSIEEERSSLPAALWDSAKPNLRPSDPSAKLIEGCITGIKRLKPPRGKLGNEAVPPPIEWHRLDQFDVPKPAAPQGSPTAGRDRDIQSVLVKKQVEQKDIIAALEASGFSLTWQSLPQAEIRFRELQADPLVGAVAA